MSNYGKRYLIFAALNKKRRIVLCSQKKNTKQKVLSLSVHEAHRLFMKSKRIDVFFVPMDYRQATVDPEQ